MITEGKNMYGSKVCCLILPDNLLEKKNAEEYSNELKEKLARLLSSLVVHYGVKHFAANVPTNDDHFICSLIRQQLKIHCELNYYRSNGEKIQKVRYDESSQMFEEQLLDMDAIPLLNMTESAKEMVQLADYIIFLLSEEEEELTGFAKWILDFAKEKNKNIVKVNEKTAEVKGYFQKATKAI